MGKPAATGGRGLLESAGDKAIGKLYSLDVADDFDNPGPVNLRGALILADPSLRDPNFARTVLLLTDHEADQGAHGYVLNRPMGKRVGDLLKDESFRDLAEVPIFHGGPVSPERLTFAVLAWDEAVGRLSFTTHLSVEDARSLRQEGGEVRAFVGYSGWAEGQLENELRQRAWITRKPAREVVAMAQPERLWEDLLSSMGPHFGLMAKMPDDPSLN
jgi:putative transcriptional regulator